MEIVVRTPHGSADVAIELHAPHITLGALIAHVTGQAAPAVARVDGRTVSCATSLGEAGLRIGTLVETDATAPPGGGEIVMGQIAGPGAGRTPILLPGRYRVGPGRRVRAGELSVAPVDEVALEIEVGPDAVVDIAPVAGTTVALGGTVVTTPRIWPAREILVVGRRAFVVRSRPTGRRRRPPTDANGTTPVHRQPRRAAPSTRQPVIDARHDADGPAPTLWERRLDHPDALAVTVGVHAPTGTRPDAFVVDLQRHHVVAVTGHESSRAALARALILDASTMHGPADLQVVVVTNRPADWDWAKWLPHLRPAGLPLILSDDRSTATWATAAGAIADTERSATARTLLVVDGADGWLRGAAPVRRIVNDPHPGLCILALGDDPGQIPERSDLLLAEGADQLWTATAFTREVTSEHTSEHTSEPAPDHLTTDILGALVEPEVAGDIARMLASCSDPDRPAGTTIAPPRHTLDEFVADDGPGVAPLLDHIGQGSPTIVVGPDPDESARAAAALALRSCLARSPASVLLLDLLRSPWTAGLAALPHAVEVPDDDVAAIDPGRLLQRLEHHARTVQALVLVDGESTLGSTLVTASRNLPGVSVLAASTEPVAPGPDLPLVVEVHRTDRRRHADLRTVDHQATVQLDGDDDVVGDLVVRPFVVGRLPSSLERRLERLRRPEPTSFVADCRRLATSGPAGRGDGSELGPRPALLPPPMPTTVDAESLLRDAPGDGVPIGLIDDVRGDPVPLWWIPGQGSVVAVGAPPSGVGEVLGTALVGLVDRFGVDDVELILVDQSAGRRRAADALAICSSTIAPNDDDSLAALVRYLERARAGAGAQLVVAIDDLGFLLRRADKLGLGPRLRAALVSSPASLVATTRSLDDLESLPSDHTTVLIGSGVDDTTTDRPPRGRVRRQADDALVQLAALGQPLGTTLAARVAEDRP